MDRSTTDQMECLGAVARCPYSIRLGLHAGVHLDRPALSERDGGVPGERNIRSGADTQDDQVGRQRATVGRYARHPAVARLEPLDRLLEVQSDADIAQRLRHEVPHVRIKRAHYGGGVIDKGYLQAAHHERLGHLQADVSAADDDGAPRLILVHSPPDADAILKDR